MVKELQLVAGASQFLNERRSSSVRSVREAELRDVIGIFQALDANLSHLLDGYLFIAPNSAAFAVATDRSMSIKAWGTSALVMDSPREIPGPARSASRRRAA